MQVHYSLYKCPAVIWAEHKNAQSPPCEHPYLPPLSCPSNGEAGSKAVDGDEHQEVSAQFTTCLCFSLHKNSYRPTHCSASWPHCHVAVHCIHVCCVFQAVSQILPVSGWMSWGRWRHISISLPLSFANNSTERTHPLHSTIVRLKSLLHCDFEEVNGKHYYLILTLELLKKEEKTKKPNPFYSQVAQKKR